MPRVLCPQSTPRNFELKDDKREDKRGIFYNNFYKSAEFKQLFVLHILFTLNSLLSLIHVFAMPIFLFVCFFFGEVLMRRLFF